MAMFEAADHGDRSRAVELPRRAWRGAPRVLSADPLRLGADPARARWGHA
jgi:hypothetical protein